MATSVRPPEVNPRHVAPPPAGALPPGPRMGRVRQGVALHRDPLGFLREAQAAFGDVFTLRLPTEGRTVVIAEPVAARRVLEADPHVALAGDGRRRILHQLPPTSVLGADGDAHRVARRRLEPVFTAEAMDARREAMERLAREHVARWPRGRPFRLLPRVRALLDDIFVRLVLGVRDEERARALVRAIGSLIWTPGNPPLSAPGLGDGLLGALVSREFARRRRPVDRLLFEELRDRRREDPGDDVIGALARQDPPLPVEEALDQIVPLLMAGQEPPAAALTWLFDRLSREPALAARFLALPGEDPAREAIVKETLRLRPPVVAAMRVLAEPAVIGGHTLPAGAVAMLPSPVLHRDPRAFAEPDAFRPERFLDAGEDPAAFFPFGGGAHRCLGEPLAHAEIATVVPAVLRRVRLTPLWPRPERMVKRGTVLVPHRSTPVIARST